MVVSWPLVYPRLTTFPSREVTAESAPVAVKVHAVWSRSVSV